MVVDISVGLWLGKIFLLSFTFIFVFSFISLNFLLLHNTSINHYVVVTIAITTVLSKCWSALSLPDLLANGGLFLQLLALKS